MELNEGSAALLGAIVGGVLAGLTTLFMHWLETRRQRKNLASAFYGDVTALLHILDLRGYLKAMEDGAAQLRPLLGVPDATLPLFSVRIQQDYLALFHANAAQIGILPWPLPEKICTFYTLGKSFIEDANRIADEGHSALPNVAEALAFLDEDARLLREIMETGREIRRLIEALYLRQRQ